MIPISRCAGGWAGLIVLALAGCGSGRSPVSHGRGAPIAIRLRTADAAEGARLFAACTACHTIGEGAPDTDGPNLYRVFGSPVAERRERFAYTAALRRVGGVWDAAKLDAWLADPQQLAPGTKMAFVGLSDPEARANLIAYLAAQAHR